MVSSLVLLPYGLLKTELNTCFPDNGMTFIGPLAATNHDTRAVGEVVTFAQSIVDAVKVLTDGPKVHVAVATGPVAAQVVGRSSPRYKESNSFSILQSAAIQ